MTIRPTSRTIGLFGFYEHHNVFKFKTVKVFDRTLYLINNHTALKQYLFIYFSFAHEKRNFKS